MVLRGDHGQLLGAVAIALEICLGDAAEQAGKSALHIGFFLTVAGAEQDVANLGGRCRGHLLGADDERDASATGFDEVHGAVERSGARGAGIFKPHRRHVAKRLVTHGDQGALEILLGKSVVHDADENTVDIFGAETRMFYRGCRDRCHQLLGIFQRRLAERRMRPADYLCFPHLTCLLACDLVAGLSSWPFLAANMPASFSSTFAASCLR